MKPLDDDGNELDALFSIEMRPDGFDLIVESRGGSTGGRLPRNSDYVPALLQHLRRMQANDMILDDVQVVSRKTIALPEGDRRILPDGFEMPLALSEVSDLESLRLSIGRACAAHRRAGQTGGNPTKRLMISMSLPGPAEMTPKSLEQLLAGRSPSLSEMPTDDEKELEARVRRVLQFLRKTEKSSSLPPPRGQTAPKKSAGSAYRYSRDPNVIAWVLCEADGICEVCGDKAPFRRADGEPYLEVHHVRRLSDGGPDTTDNAVACCPNCHRKLHYGVNHDILRQRTIGRLARLEDYPEMVDFSTDQ